MTANALRPELPPLPDRIRRLPVDARGYPVPWFVEWIDGAPEFRIMDGRKFVAALQEHRCWVCGERLGGYMAFTVGPMCAVNRVSAEPPSHRDCAVFSAMACPFLTRPHMRRRTGGVPEEAEQPGGIMLERNPGVALVWLTKRYKLAPQKGQSPLFRMGDPVDVLAFAEGRQATAAELRASIESGLPILRDMATEEGRGALRALAHSLEVACTVLCIPQISMGAPLAGGAT